MPITITASGEVLIQGPVQQARMLSTMFRDPVALQRIVDFIVAGGRGSVILSVGDGGIKGVRIDLIVY